MSNVVPQHGPDPDLPEDDNALKKLIRKDSHTSAHPADFHTSFHPSEKDDDGPGAKRTRDGVSVFGVDEINDVFLNLDGNYSVKGYAERSSHAFGEFFLGLDDGPEYRAQAGPINEAIMKFSMADGFRAGVAATLKTLPDMKASPPDAQELTDGMLAEVCKPLFGLPDGKHIISSGDKLHIFGPGRCPADFAPLSGYIFLPDPGLVSKIMLTVMGRHAGKLLKEDTLEFVKKLRETKLPPGAPFLRVLFETTDVDDDDLFARTLVGVMMGLLPTIEGNMIQAITSMRGDGSYDMLAAKIRALPEPLDPDTVASLLKEPVFAAIQVGPMPPAVWRTAVKDHHIGSVEVKAGDMVSIEIKSATNAELKQGKCSVLPVFGGDRSASPHPTHACPGYELAVGIMLGSIATAMKA